MKYFVVILLIGVSVQLRTSMSVRNLLINSLEDDNVIGLAESIKFIIRENFFTQVILLYIKSSEFNELDFLARNVQALVPTTIWRLNLSR